MEGSVPVVLEQVDVLHKPTVEVLHSSAGGIRVWIIHAVYTRGLDMIILLFSELTLRDHNLS